MTWTEGPVAEMMPGKVCGTPVQGHSRRGLDDSVSNSE